MAGFHLFPSPASKISLVVQTFAATLLLLNLALVANLSKHARCEATLPLLAFVLTAFYLPVVNWALQGAEVSLLAVLTTASVLLALRDLRTGRASLLLYGVLAFGTFVRPDMAVQYMAIAAFMAVEDRDN